MSEPTTHSTNEFSLSIEQLLADDCVVRIKPQGYSMYPLFIPGRDEALIERTDPQTLKRGDVALYRRDGSILVLHRIFKVTDKGFYMVGDNQTEIEGPLRPDQIRGKLTAFVRHGHSRSVENVPYRILSGLWLSMRPIRPLFWHVAAMLRKIAESVHKSAAK